MVQCMAIKTVRIIAMVALVCSVGGATASAADVPLSADKLTLRRNANGHETLVFTSRDDAVESLSFGGDNPSWTGVTIDLLAQHGVEIATLTIPPENGEGRWTTTGGVTDPPVFRYKNPEAPLGETAVRSFQLDFRRLSLKIVADAAGLALTGPSGPVGIRVTLGNARGCAHFDAATTRKDKARLFSAVHASSSALPDCYDNSVAGVPPLCGDHLSSANEQCDGSCPIGGFGCVVPTASNECTCCSNGFPSSLPCCQPSKVWYPAPNAKFCYPNSCAPPFQCASADVCQPDDTCCHGLGTICATAQLGNLLDCCAGTICARGTSTPAGPALACCVPSGNACTNSADCCSDDCSSGVCG